jgi:hypothetical protein
VKSRRPTHQLVGDFKNGGRELHPKGRPEPVRVHDFVIPELGKVVPYGVYDIAANAGWVNLGVTHDTAAFAVESIRRWWHGYGAARYPAATRLLITADCGGSNGVRVRLWKRELQVLADELGVTITVCHLPPGTSSRVEVWRSCCRLNISVSTPFVWRCLTGSAVAPFPHPAHRTGQADLPHPALGQDVTPSPTTGRDQAGSGVRARSARKGARVDRLRPCVARPCA